jgi:cytochrome P450
LGVDLREQDRRMVSEAGTVFLSSTTWKIAYASLKLPASTPHPGGATMRHAGDNLRKVAERVLANRRQGLGDGADLLARLVTAQDPGTGARMSEA